MRDRYREGGPEALQNRPSAPSRVWNRIPDAIHEQIIEPGNAPKSHMLAALPVAA